METISKKITDKEFVEAGFEGPTMEQAALHALKMIRPSMERLSTDRREVGAMRMSDAEIAAYLDFTKNASPDDVGYYEDLK